MTRPLRVGVIGANPNRSWAKDSHIPALRSLENVQLAAVATTSRADAAAAAFGVRAAYDDPRTPHDAVSVIGCNTATRPASEGDDVGEHRVDSRAAVAGLAQSRPSTTIRLSSRGKVTRPDTTFKRVDRGARPHTLS